MEGEVKKGKEGVEDEEDKERREGGGREQLLRMISVAFM